MSGLTTHPLIILGLCGAIGLAMAVTPFHRVPPSLRAMWHKIPHRHIIEFVISGFRQHGPALNLTLDSLITGTVMTAVLIAAGHSIGIGIGTTVTYMQMLVIMTFKVPLL